MLLQNIDNHLSHYMKSHLRIQQSSNSVYISCFISCYMSNSTQIYCFNRSNIYGFSHLACSDSEFIPETINLHFMGLFARELEHCKASTSTGLHTQEKPIHSHSEGDLNPQSESHHNLGQIM
jgi:hypothetical protein